MGQAEMRLSIIARAWRERGSYALGLADVKAIDAVLAKLSAHEPAPPAPDDELVSIIRALLGAGWRLTRVQPTE